MARHQPQSGSRGRRAEVKSVVHRHHHAQQTHRNTDADDGENGPTPIAPTVLPYEREIAEHTFHLRMRGEGSSTRGQREQFGLSFGDERSGCFHGHYLTFDPRPAHVFF
jgi:hypothetical protein